MAAAAVVWMGLAGVTLRPAWRDWVRNHWRWTLEPQFHDWHVVRLGWQAHAVGVDPLAAADQPFNYPRFILHAAPLGRRIPADVAGLLTAGLFLGALAWVLRPQTYGEALLGVAIVAAQPTLLMIERGNLDSWAFVFVALGIAMFARRSPQPWTALSGTLALLLATLLKLYPAALFPAAALFWRGSRRGWSAAGFAVWVLWLMSSVDEVILILQKTTRGFEPAYGRMIAASRFFVERLAPRQDIATGQQTLAVLMNASLVLCLVGFAVAGWIGVRTRSRFADVHAAPVQRAWFWSGALIYAGTFLLGTNWAYRLVFLALCVPLLWRAARTPRIRTWGVLGLLGAAVMLLSPFHLPLGLFLAHEIVAWALAFLLLGGAAAFLVRGDDGLVEDVSSARPTDVKKERI